MVQKKASYLDIREAMMTWGRGFSLCKAIDVEIVLLHKVVHKHKENIVK